MLTKVASRAMRRRCFGDGALIPCESTRAATSTTTRHSRPPLVDTHGRVHTYLRISITERCNLRCIYCMPEEGITLAPNPALLTTDEIVRLTNVFAEMGVTKVRLTGGEPTIRKDIVDVCGRIAAVPGIKTLAMTTNGIVLHRYISELRRVGLTALNISLDTMEEDKFMLITRRNGFHKVIDSIALAEALHFSPVKVNCVVMRGLNEGELGKFADLTRDRPLEVRFIEYMPFDDNKWNRGKMFSFMEMMDVIERHVGAKLVHDGAGETAQLFRVPGFAGRLGFIASMTTAFCGTCNRVRLTADGNLKVCLFGSDLDEVSLRDVMRNGGTDDDIAATIYTAVSKKHFAHGGKGTLEDLAASHNRPMIKIGG